jgi:hypothetical protein
LVGKLYAVDDQNLCHFTNRWHFDQQLWGCS